MTEPYTWDESADGVEAMVRAAGQYVGASDDLRPRVLEAVRLQCGEQWTRRCLRHAALVVVLLALVTAEFRQGLNEQRSPFNVGMVNVGFDALISPTPAAVSRSGDGDWRLIDAFTKLRRQQAQMLRLEI